MVRLDQISGKFEPPENRKFKTDVKIVLHRSPFIDRTNILQVPSNSNNDISKVVPKRKENDVCEVGNAFKNRQTKSRTLFKKLDDNKIQRELRVNVNNILLNNDVPQCTKIMEVNNTGITKINNENVFSHGVHNNFVKSHIGSIESTKTGDENIVKTLHSGLQSKKDYVGLKEYYKLYHNPKFNLRCVVQLEKFDYNKSSMKSSSDVKSTIQEVQLCTNDIYRKNISTSARENNEGDKSKIIPIINRSTSPKYLRKRFKKNYAEMSLDKSKELVLPSSVPSKKIPIYKIQQSEDIKAKKRTDIYEFDEVDSVKVKNRRKKNDINISAKFDKSMYNILKKIETKEAKLQAKNKRKVTKGVRGARKHKEPLQEIRKKVVRKVSTENKPESKNLICNIVKCSTNVPESIPEHRNDPENKNHIESTVDHDKNIRSVEIMPEHEIQISDININVPEDDSDDDSGEFFDFAEVQHSTPVKINPKINIISNIAVKEIDHSNLFDSLKPNANSTMLPSDRKSPWRFNERLKRNPHFISLKRTALPCLQQDMVLDYVQLERSECFSNNKKTTETPKKKLVQEKATDTPKKKLVQKNIMEFMNVSPSVVIEKENIPHSSLFDYDDFSPPKKTKSSRDISKNNAKRNILGLRQNNLENIQANDGFTRVRTFPSEKSLTKLNDNNDVDTYFGFDDDSDVVLPENKRASVARPYRINQIVRKKQDKEVTETELVGHDLTDLQESLDLQPEANSKEVGLFEDPEQAISLNVPSKIYERKRRRKRLLSVDANEEEPQPKKKNIMSKKEEDEFEKWAAQFNSECEEIEKYDLEIE